MGDDLTSLTGPITSVHTGLLTNDDITISTPSNDVIQFSPIQNRIEEVEHHMYSMESTYDASIDLLREITCRLTKKINDLEEIIRIVCDKYILNEE